MKRFVAILIAVVFIASFGAGTVFAGGAAEDAPQQVELLYVEWAGEIAATYVAEVVLEEMGYNVTSTALSAAAMWEGIASGEADGMLSAWLPHTHGAYRDQTEGRVEELSTVLEGARIGLMVPTYVEIDSIEELNDHADRFGGEIIGIDPGAGIMAAAEEAMDVYGLDNMTLVESSDAAMQSALASAYDAGDWIVVTGWTPHPKEGRHDLKYLEDPELVFGEVEYVAAVVRNGLQDDMPEVYQFLDNFHWEVEQFAELMEWNANDEHGGPYENAQVWVEENRDIVENWIP